MNSFVGRVCSTAMKYNDGGRGAAGYKGEARDCVTRAIAIATGKSYAEIYDTLNGLAKSQSPKLVGGRRRRKSSSRDGIPRMIYEKYLAAIGWQWTPTMAIGSGCKVHLRADELPGGTLIVRVSKHICAVVDGVVHDTHDPSRDGARCVYGYYSKHTLDEQRAVP